MLEARYSASEQHKVMIPGNTGIAKIQTQCLVNLCSFVAVSSRVVAYISANPQKAVGSAILQITEAECL